MYWILVYLCALLYGCVGRNLDVGSIRHGIAQDLYGVDAILDNQHTLSEPGVQQVDEKEMWLDDFTNDKVR